MGDTEILTRTHFNDHMVQCLLKPFVGHEFRPHHRLNLNNVGPGINRNMATKIMMFPEEAQHARKAAIIPWPALTSSRKNLIAVLRKRTPLYLPSHAAIVLSREKEVTKRTLTMVTKSRDNRKITRSGSVDRKLTPLIGERTHVLLNAWTPLIDNADVLQSSLITAFYESTLYSSVFMRKTFSNVPFHAAHN
jgi:hypothetical protein